MFSEETSLKEWVNWALQANAASEIVAFGLLPGDIRHLSATDQCVPPIFRVGGGVFNVCTWYGGGSQEDQSHIIFLAHHRGQGIVSALLIHDT